MRHEFRLADIGEGLEEAEILNWLVEVGDTVSRDQPLIEVMTDKSNAELPAPTAGTVVELGGAIGDLITVGEIVAVIITSDVPTADEPGAGGPAGPAPTPPAVVPQAMAAPAATASLRIKASPSTRRQAAERGVDLTTVTGTGPGGRILLSDLDATTAFAVTPDPVTPDPVTPDPVTPDPVRAVSASPTSGVVPLRGVRRAVAKNMAQSWSEIPHIHAFAHVDAEPMMRLRRRLRATDRAEYQQLTPLSFFVAAVARALVVHPHANASLNMVDETITYNPQVNVGVAVASPAGLVVPVLQGADRLSFGQLCVALNELVHGAREGNLPREHFRNGTVTITNFGALGGEQATPLIRPPEAMILGFGSIAERPFVVDSHVVAQPTMHTVAGADHRLLDGDTTTAVLSLVNELLTDPLQLVL